MAPETVHEHLARVLGAEGVPFEAACLLARAARGSMRDAPLTDQAIALWQRGQPQEQACATCWARWIAATFFALIEVLAVGDGRLHCRNG